jgi:hypothetical protein
LFRAGAGIAPATRAPDAARAAAVQPSRSHVLNIAPTIVGAPVGRAGEMP